MKMIIDRLKKLVKKNEEKTWYIETLENLCEATIKLKNAKDIVKDEIELFRSVRKYMGNELIEDKYKKLDVIKYRLERLKEIIEKIEEIIIDAEGPSVEDEQEDEEEEECEEDY